VSFVKAPIKTQHLIVLLDCHAERLHGKRQQSNGGQGCPPNISVLQKFFDFSNNQKTRLGALLGLLAWCESAGVVGKFELA